MVLPWIGIGVGVLLAVILIVKLRKTPPHEAVSADYRCKVCGQKTNGLKCPRCEGRSRLR